MKKIFTVAILAILLSGCGKQPQGGFLTLNIDDKKALVAIDEAKPVLFTEMEQPLDLMAIPHKVSVTWSATGDTTTEFATVEFGKTTTFTPTPPKLEPVEITTSMPGTITAGFIDLGHSSKISNPQVYAGKRRFEVAIDGFQYRWATEIDVGLNSKINLEPGTDSSTGALYIKSQSQGTSFKINGTEEQPLFFEGSVFIPKVAPCMLEISEKANSLVKHYVQIEAGKVTKLNYLTNFEDTSKKRINLDTFGKTTLYLCWGSQTSTIDLTGKKQLDGYTLDKSTPFRPGTMNSDEVFKFLVCKNGNGFGAKQIIGALPERISVERVSGSMVDPSTFKQAKVQNWSPKSDDGQWYVENDMIYGPGGFRFALSGYDAGCWDTLNYTVLVTKLDLENETFEVREAPLSKKNPMIIGTFGHKGIGDKNLKWVNAYSFYDSKGFPIVVLASSKWTAVYERETSTEIGAGAFKPAFKLDKPCFTASLSDKRFLTCKTGNSTFSGSFVLDLQTGMVYENLINPTSTEDKLILCNHLNGANAGVAYRISGKTLVPVWAGIYQLPNAFVE